jgi:uncharacterized protein with FMN-binding domain
VQRALMALLGTAAGTVLLVGAKAGFSAPQSDGALQPQSANGGSAAPRGAGASGGTQKAPAGTKATASGAPKRTALKNGTFRGDSVDAEYGNVQLSIVVAGGKITDVKVLEAPTEHARSVQINGSALPKLRAEALAAQSADIDTVSGATYTSGGYQRSLQSAIDKARQA